MDKCPCCERAFEGLEDFPLVQVVSFKLEKPLEQLSHAVEDYKIYVDPSSKSANDKVPKEVLELFKTAQGDVVHYYGWNWRRFQSRVDSFSYKRFQEVPIKLPETVASYVSRLESLVGKEVPVKELFPPFERDNYFYRTFNIPESEYALTFLEDKEHQGENRQTQLNLLGNGPNLGSAGGPTLESLATIATLQYQGRVKK